MYLPLLAGVTGSYSISMSYVLHMSYRSLHMYNYLLTVYITLHILYKPLYRSMPVLCYASDFHPVSNFFFLATLLSLELMSHSALLSPHTPLCLISHFSLPL